MTGTAGDPSAKDADPSSTPKDSAQETQVQNNPANAPTPTNAKGESNIDRDSDMSAEETVIGAHIAIIANKQTKGKGAAVTKDVEPEGMLRITIVS